MQKDEPALWNIFREKLKKLKIDEPAATIILASNRQSTKKKYKPHLEKWFSYLERIGEDKLNPKIENILNYLAILYEEGASFNKICDTKSAISSYVNLESNITLDALPIVKKFIKGIYELRPSLPCHSRMARWDPGIVLNHIKQWFPHETLELKLLSFKLVFLLAILSGQRVQTISSICTKNVIFNGNRCSILIDNLLKTSRKGVQLGPIELVSYNQENLCIINILKIYLQRTQALRKGEKLLISFQSPWKAISSETVARWIKQLLRMSGINTTAHSTRSLSTSIAAAVGMPISEIIKSAGWTSQDTFNKYYNISKVNKNFGQTVLQSIDRYKNSILNWN